MSRQDFAEGELFKVFIPSIQTVVTNLWTAAFTAAKVFCACVMTILLAVAVSAKKETWPLLLAVTLHTAITLTMPYLVFRLKYKHAVDLAGREYATYGSMYNHLFHLLQKWRAIRLEGKLNDRTKVEARAEIDALNFGDSAMAFRKRGFHLWFMHLSSAGLSETVMWVSQYLIYLLSGYAFHEGDVTVGEFIVVVGISTDTLTLGSEVITIFENLPEAYAALLSIAAVLNAQPFQPVSKLCTNELNNEPAPEPAAEPKWFKGDQL